MKRAKKRLLLIGVPSSPGYAIGKAFFLRSQSHIINKGKISAERIPKEISLYKRALAKSIKEISVLKERVQQDIGADEAKIFQTHILLLQDPMIVEEVEQKIMKEQREAAFVFHSHMQGLMQKMKKQNNETMRERVHDLNDVYTRVMQSLSASQYMNSAVLPSEPVILISHNMTPSSITLLEKKNTLGFATDTGGRTSHVSILARSMQIPAVAGLKNISVLINDGDQLIIDGTSGMVIINPTLADLEKYREKMERFTEHEKDLFATRDLDPVTVDGKYIRLNANIELPLEAESAIRYGANGIGLYRSEFLFFKNELPSEEEQYKAYTQILECFFPRSVTVRTLDAGGDKLVPHLSVTDEANPFMGWRSIRVCLDRPEIFKSQLRAILRSSVSGNLRIMLPMVTSLIEIQRAKQIIAEVQKELDQQDIPYHPNIELGVMIEVPAAVMLAKEFAREVDFFSIGTNDLIQFTLAVDRSNERIASMFEPLHPAVLHMIRMVVDAAHGEGLDVSVCGEMASDPYSALLLIGMGVDELSMSPWAIMEIKKFIRSITLKEAKEAAIEALALTSAGDINELLHRKYSAKLNDLGVTSFVGKEVLPVAEKLTQIIKDQALGSSLN
jgi:phosphoenolpyruvate-protein phosphotransferase (PTS system enzyme I)